MSKKPKLPAERVRTWIPWTLLGLALVEGGLAIFQWHELRVVQAGGSTVCSINAIVNCETVWSSPFAQRMSTLTGLPVAGLGIVWGAAAAVCAAALAWRARTGRSLRPAVLPVRTSALVGVLACVTFAAGSFSAGGLCLTCLGTYLLVLAYAALALRGLPGTLGPGQDEWGRAVGLPAASAALVWIGLLLGGGKQEPARIPRSTASTSIDGPAAELSTFLASRPQGERQALSDALARFARTPAQPSLSAPRVLLGTPDAPVHLVEWADVLCPHCRHLNDALEELRQAVPPNRLAIEARNYPLDRACNPDVPQKGDGLRCDGALALICLEKAPDFWTLRKKVFEAQRTLNRDSLISIASSGSVTRSQLEACMAGPEAQNKLQDDIRYARQYHPTGTPVVVINGKMAPATPVFLYALAMANGDPTAPVLTSVLPPAGRSAAQ
jgi:serine/threonine-protein kinase